LFPTHIAAWRAEFLANANSVFVSNIRCDRDFQKGEKKEEETLYAQIGRLNTENDWLKKADIRPIRSY
jgi:transposase